MSVVSPYRRCDSARLLASRAVAAALHQTPCRAEVASGEPIGQRA